MPDYAKEIEKYPDMPEIEKQEMQKLASMQRDIAIGDSAEDFIRHPFFRSFEIKMNEMINDSKNKILEIETADELKAFKQRIAAIRELKEWLNAHVIKGRVARQAIDVYEKDTQDMNAKIQEAIDKSNAK